MIDLRINIPCISYTQWLQCSGVAVQKSLYMYAADVSR